MSKLSADPNCGCLFTALRHSCNCLQWKWKIRRRPAKYRYDSKAQIQPVLMPLEIVTWHCDHTVVNFRKYQLKYTNMLAFFCLVACHISFSFFFFLVILLVCIGLKYLVADCSSSWMKVQAWDQSNLLIFFLSKFIKLFCLNNMILVSRLFFTFFFSLSMN